MRIQPISQSFLECNTNEGTWIEQEIIRLEDILDKTEFHLQRSSLTAVQRKRYIKRRENTRKFLERAQVRTLLPRSI